MNRTTPENKLRNAKRRLASPSSTNPATTSSGVDTRPVQIIAEKLEVRKLLAPASPLQRILARVVAAKKPAKSKKEIKQQNEALNTWEDEGGNPAPAVTRPGS